MPKKRTSQKIVLNDKFVWVMLKCHGSIVACESEIAGVISLVQLGTKALEMPLCADTDITAHASVIGLCN